MKKGFTPNWNEQAPVPGSYRSIFKFSGPTEFKHPSSAMVGMMKDEFGMTDADFRTRIDEGNEPVTVDTPPALAPEHVAKLTEIVGAGNVSQTDYDRVKYSRAQTVGEVFDLRHGTPRQLADLVVHPKDKDDVRRIVAFCNEHRIPLVVNGAGSSVVRGLSPEKGGIVLAMGTHMNRVVKVNELNQTVTVQPGMMGPDFEAALNDAPRRFHTKRAYTCGHFPQSFEMSSVGGWGITYGSGQASTYYGDAADMVVSQEYVTPVGEIRTLEYPATATGPKLNDLFKGSEGAFGVLVELTVNVFRHMPENRSRFAFMFPTWEDAVDASREIMQGEFGLPAVYRISDGEETDRGLKIYGIDSPLFERFLARRGLAPMKRSLLIGTAEGDRGHTRLVKKRVTRICKSYGAMRLPAYAVRRWERTRFKEPMMRDDCMDFGIIIDTLETGVTWENVLRLHREVRAVVKSRPKTMCMTHASHFYPGGTNLYFVFLLKPEPGEDFEAFHRQIVDAIVKSGGSISHHHGVGKMLAPWMETHLGKEQVDVLRALKRHFDPNGILNPGGLLSLDRSGADGE